MCNKGNQGLKLCTRKYVYNTRQQWWTRTTPPPRKKKKQKQNHVRHRENESKMSNVSPTLLLIPLNVVRKQNWQEVRQNMI